MPRYPTKEEILSKEVTFRKGTIDAVNEWKEALYDNGMWKSVTDAMKLASLYTLLMNLAKIYKKPVDIILGNTYCYNILTQTIMLDECHPSIISALHEFGHHILGASELKACRWSVWLFKTCFPSLFSKLTWRGHMLVK